LDKVAQIGLLSGSGISDIGIFTDIEEIKMKTPYGKTSDSIIVGQFENKKIAFMARHGTNHSIPPHLVNYRANIWAFKEIGVKRIIGFFTVGSLRDEIGPGKFVLPTQFIDFTKKRNYTFFDEGTVAHISIPEPFCPELKNEILYAANSMNLNIHEDSTYICIEGPRFSTRAESKFFRSVGADIIGMTIVPECQLATEAQMCYGPICITTDSDIFSEKGVTLKEVKNTFSKNSELTKELIQLILKNISIQRTCSCKKILGDGIFLKNNSP